MAATVAAARAGVVLMHSRGSILEIASYTHADYAGDVVGEVLAELREALARGRRGRRRAPGDAVSTPDSDSPRPSSRTRCCSISLAALQALGRPLLVGPSRKRFLGAVTGQPVEDARPGHRDGVRAGLGARRAALPGPRRGGRARCPHLRLRAWEVRSAARAAAVSLAGLAGPARDPHRRVRRSTRCSGFSSARGHSRSCSACWCSPSSIWSPSCSS